MGRFQLKVKDYLFTQSSLSSHSIKSQKLNPFRFFINYVMSSAGISQERYLHQYLQLNRIVQMTELQVRDLGVRGSNLCPCSIFFLEIYYIYIYILIKN